MVVIKNVLIVVISFIYCCYSSSFLFTLNFRRTDIFKKTTSFRFSVGQSSAHRPDKDKEMLGAVYISWFLRVSS